MASERRPLRVDVPTLEPDPALLARLSALSARSAPARRPMPTGRILAAAATVAVIGTTSWAAGALPGTAPFSPAQQPTSTPTDLASPGDVGTPQPDDVSSPGGPMSPGPPGEHSSDSTGPSSGDHGAPREPGAQPPRPNPGKGDGDGNGNGRGHARGHLENPAPAGPRHDATPGPRGKGPDGEGPGPRRPKDLRAQPEPTH